MRIVLAILAICMSCIVNAQTISISTSKDTVCSGTAVVFTATTTATSPHYQWRVNNTNAGNDASSLNISTLMNNDSVICLLTDATGTNVLAISSSIHIRVLPRPDAGSIIANDTSVCIGATIVLSNTVAGGVWSTNNSCIGLSSGTVLGRFVLGRFEGHIIPAVAEVYYVVSDGVCQDTAKQTITTNTIRPANLYYPPDAACVGKPTPFWENEPIENIFGTTGHVSASTWGITGISVGIDYVYNITTNVCGSDTAGMRIEVLDKPPISPILGPTEVCVGASIALSAATTGYFNWTTSNANATVSQFLVGGPKGGVVTGVSAGIDTIVLSTWNNCGSISMTLPIKINPPGPITGLSSVCEGRSISLSNATPGGTWQSYSTAMGRFDTASHLFTGIAEGRDTIYYDFANGCRVKKPIEIKHSPEPLAISEYLCLGEEVDLAVPGGGVWAFNYPDIITVDKFSPNRLRAADGGSVVIQYTLPTGCFTAAPVTVVSCNGDFNIFPSPVRGTLIVQNANSALDGFAVLNSIGSLMMTGKTTGKHTAIDVTTLASGTYFIKLTGGGKQVMGRFVKE